MNKDDDSFKKYGYDNIRIAICIGGLIVIVILFTIQSIGKISEENKNSVSMIDVPEISDNSILDDISVSNSTISGIDMN